MTDYKDDAVITSNSSDPSLDLPPFLRPDYRSQAPTTYTDNIPPLNSLEADRLKEQEEMQQKNRDVIDAFGAQKEFKDVLEKSITPQGEKILVFHRDAYKGGYAKPRTGFDNYTRNLPNETFVTHKMIEDLLSYDDCSLVLSQYGLTVMKVSPDKWEPGSYTWQNFPNLFDNRLPLLKHICAKYPDTAAPANFPTVKAFEDGRRPKRVLLGKQSTTGGFLSLHIPGGLFSPHVRSFLPVFQDRLESAVPEHKALVEEAKRRAEEQERQRIEEEERIRMEKMKRSSLQSVDDVFKLMRGE